MLAWTRSMKRRRCRSGWIGQFIVFGLGKEIHGHPVGVGGAVRHHEISRAGHHVDPDDAEDAALGAGDVGIAWGPTILSTWGTVAVP